MNNRTEDLFPKYSQNAIINKNVLDRLVNQSSITANDLVYDIGAGSGVISRALLKKGARVTAIEKDLDIYLKCKKYFTDQDEFELYLDDFLLWQFPPGEKYKVFSNIPFSHTADIISKLLFGDNPPEDCYLIVQKEAAKKYAGIPGDTLISLLIKPLFWVDILYYFKKYDFQPVPSVDIALIQFEKRRCCLVPTHNYSLYKKFVVLLREGQASTVKRALKQVFTYTELKHLSRLLHISVQSNPADLSFTQYLGLFQFYLDNASEIRLKRRNKMGRI